MFSTDPPLVHLLYPRLTYLPIFVVDFVRLARQTAAPKARRGSRRAAVGCGLALGLSRVEGVRVGLGCGVRGGGLDWEWQCCACWCGPIKFKAAVCVGYQSTQRMQRRYRPSDDMVLENKKKTQRVWRLSQLSVGGQICLASAKPKMVGTQTATTMRYAFFVPDYRRANEVLCFVPDNRCGRQRVIWHCVQGEGNADGGDGNQIASSCVASLH
jgi:hypothetical protein